MKNIKFLFLLFFLCSSSLSALTFKDGKQINENNTIKYLNNMDLLIEAGIDEKMAKALSGIGLNTIETWSACEQKTLDFTISQLEKIIDDGWSYLTFFECIDNNFLESSSGEIVLNNSIVKQRAYNLAEKIEYINNKYPNLIAGVAIKARDPFGGWDAGGIRTLKIYKALMDGDIPINLYGEMLEIYASEFKSKELNNFFISPMNEPEYHTFQSPKEEYLKHLKVMISAIRKHLPNVTLLVEGTNKSLLGRGIPLNSMMPIVKDKNVIYGFHYYEPHKITHARDKHIKFLSQSEINKIKNDIFSMIEFAEKFQVPVILSEFGIWGEIMSSNGELTGASDKVRADFTRAIQEILVKNNIGLTWFSLNDKNTPYKRVDDSIDKTTRDFRKSDVFWDALFNTK